MTLNFCRKAVTYIISLAVIFIVFGQTSEKTFIIAVNQSNSEETTSAYNREGSYQNYIEKVPSNTRPEATIRITAVQLSDNSSVTLEKYLDKENVILFDGETNSAVFRFIVEKSGIYQLDMMYASLIGDNIRNIEFSLLLDGETIFDAAGRLRLMRSYQTIGGITQDKNGNDIRPQREIVPLWILQTIDDPDGITNGAFSFYLEAGEHQVQIDTERAAFALEYFEFTNSDEAMTYQEYQDKYCKENSVDSAIKSIYIPAESPKLISNVSIYATYDRSGSATEPADPSKLKLNTIGQSNWNQVGQWIVWEFDVETAGYYNILFRARQNIVKGSTSTRKIMINNQLLFENMKNVKFPFQSNWFIKVLGDENPYLFYFGKGHYEIKMEAVSGDVAPVIQSTENIIYQLNYLYRKIIMITGVSPDQYFDYQLEKGIPDLLANFKGIKEELTSMYNLLESIGVKKGGESAVFERLAYQMESFIQKPTTIALRLTDFKSNISTLSAMILSLKDQPLELDYLMVVPQGTAIPEANDNIWNTFIYKFKAFIHSFSTDYDTMGNGDLNESAETIDVWVSLGRDQAQILKDLTDNNFIAKHGINVNISLVQQGLIEATLAGKGPDIAVFVDSSTPVNLAARGALINLKEFEGFDEVKSRFVEFAMEQYQYNDGCYALPVSQDFSMLFYRKDIFEELGIEPPTTWGEFYKIIPVIQKNNMEIGIPNDTGIFDTLLFQNGGEYYTDDRSSTKFDSSAALKAFKQWTGFYTKYSFPQAFDFYNRFRTGEMPMGIQSYSMYNQLSVAAPEIKNLWDMIPIPGTVQDDGNVDNTTALSGTSCIAFKNAGNSDKVWKFMTWLTSADTQYEYGIGLESLLGTAGRYNTANVEALVKIPWSSREYLKISSQMEHVKAAPQIPASYYVGRHLTNAFRKVVYGLANPRETLSVYNKEINKEIERKNIELGRNE